MKSFTDLINDCLSEVKELFPWDLSEKLEAGERPMLLDIREPYEFDAMRIEDSVCVPRGILETACDWGYEETVPELVQARDKEIIIICRSGNRSIVAAHVMQLMGYQDVLSLKTGLRGWNDFEQPLVNEQGAVDIDNADEYFMSLVKSHQLKPKD